MMPPEVNQFATDLFGGEADEATSRFWPFRLQSAIQPDKRVLKHVVGLIPATDGWVISQPFAGKPAEAFHRVFDQFVSCRFVSSRQPIQQPLNDRRVPWLFAHACHLIEKRGVGFDINLVFLILGEYSLDSKRQKKPPSQPVTLVGSKEQTKMSDCTLHILLTGPPRCARPTDT